MFIWVFNRFQMCRFCFIFFCVSPDTAWRRCTSAGMLFSDSLLFQTVLISQLSYICVFSLFGKFLEINNLLAVVFSPFDWSSVQSFAISTVCRSKIRASSQFNLSNRSKSFPPEIINGECFLSQPILEVTVIYHSSFN